MLTFKCSVIYKCNQLLYCKPACSSLYISPAGECTTIYLGSVLNLQLIAGNWSFIFFNKLLIDKCMCFLGRNSWDIHTLYFVVSSFYCYLRYSYCLLRHWWQDDHNIRWIWKNIPTSYPKGPFYLHLKKEKVLRSYRRTTDFCRHSLGHSSKIIWF